MIRYEKLELIVGGFVSSSDMSDGKVLEFDTGVGMGKLIYVKHGNRQYRRTLHDLFGIPRVYSRWTSDFVIFYLEGKPLAAGTYTQDQGTSVQVEETTDLTNVIMEELMAVA